MNEQLQLPTDLFTDTSNSKRKKMTLPGDPIPANELRPGNIVLANGHPIRVESSVAHFKQDILKRTVSTFGQHVNNNKVVHGLPLDNVWLRRLGFEEVGSFWHLEEIILDKKSETSYGWLVMPTMEVRYVHQLQNLMFAVRGFEDHVMLTAIASKD